MSDNFNILTITHPDVENGIGCRVTIWAAGCSHHCPGCHNQHTWDYNQGVHLNDNKVKSIIYDKVKPDYIKGITLSGGDALSQSDAALGQLLEFLVQFKNDFPSKDIWIYSGETFESAITNDIKKKVLQLCTVLVDGNFVKEKYDPDLAFRGSSNQRIIDLQKTFEQGFVVEKTIE